MRSMSSYSGPHLRWLDGRLLVTQALYRGANRRKAHAESGFSLPRPQRRRADLWALVPD
jgi:hypothetical protein